MVFEILFGWRKASTCKKLIRRTQCRLKLLKNKRDSIVRQLRQDVVQLITNGHEERAFSRIEQLYKDQSIKAIYDLLDNFCEFVIINLSYIRRHRDCPNDVNEAVSSLLYASARCGDLPELLKLRKLFGERYGQRFAMTAVELLHGNLVNLQIIENLSMKSIPDDSKLELMKEIAKDDGLQLNYPETNVGKTASESPSGYSESSIVYLDDVDQLQVSMKEDVKSNTKESCEAITISLSEESESSSDVKSSYGSAIKKRSSRKRFKRRYVLVEDVECALYYGVSEDDLFSLTSPSYPERKKILSPKCSLEHPCCFITQDLPNTHPSSDEEFGNTKGLRGITTKEMEEAEVIDCRRSSRPPYLRAMTMPPERPKETHSCIVQRSSSCLPNEHIGSPSYVHPKLPDYDDLAAKFGDLRKGSITK